MQDILAGTSSSKCLGKREVTNKTKDVAIKNDKKVKCKIKAIMTEKRESDRVTSMELTYLTKRRELDTDKLHLHGDPDEKIMLLQVATHA